MEDLTADEVLKKLTKNEKLNMIDVRENEEVLHGMIPGAVHIPLGEIPSRMSELDKETEYILICRSGNRSGMAKELLNGHGFNTVNMLGGMLDWTGETKQKNSSQL